MQSKLNKSWRLVCGATSVALYLFCALSASADDGGNRRGECTNEHWAATWSTALDPPEVLPVLSNGGFKNQTLRQIIHTTIGGRRVRVRLSAVGATNGVLIGSAHIALSAGGPAIDKRTDRVLTFGGSRAITIPAGAPVVSDPVEMDLPALSDVAISIFVPGVTAPASWHFDSRQTSYISASGDFTANNSLPLDATTPTTQSWFWLSGLDVLASDDTITIAAIGDSLTDGDQSSVDQNARWPDWVARRLSLQPYRKASVLNLGLDGSRLLYDGLGPNALARFENDVLSQPGVTHVILFDGTSDIGTGWSGGSNPNQEVSVDQMIQGYRQLIERAHTRGLKIIGATLTPVLGSVVPGTPFPLYSPGNELKRLAVNTWIRKAGEFDGFVDFDRVLRDPAVPAKLLGSFDSGDHLHPNDAGYRAMANAVESVLLR